MFDVIDLPMDWPAEVNYHEAKAFCAWKGTGYRLPTEAEHHVMRGHQVYGYPKKQKMVLGLPVQQTLSSILVINQSFRAAFI